MTSDSLDNLARIGQLKAEPARDDELAGLLRSGRARLNDASREDLSFESRYLVFQVLPHTTGLATGHWRVLAKAHSKRNLAEYEG